MVFFRTRSIHTSVYRIARGSTNLSSRCGNSAVSGSCSLRSRPGLRVLSILLRAEDPGRVHERRSPLSPESIKALRQAGVDHVYVQSDPSKRRIFKDEELSRAGATVFTSSGSGCDKWRDIWLDADLVLGIKEPALAEAKDVISYHKLHSSKEQTWLMFSHTHKGKCLCS